MANLSPCVNIMVISEQCVCRSDCLTGYRVVSLLLEHWDLAQPGPGSQQLGLGSTSELILPEHLAFLLGAPVHVVLEHTDTEGVSHI